MILPINNILMQDGFLKLPPKIYKATGRSIADINNLTEVEIEQLYRLFMEHPSGAVKKKLHVVYLNLNQLVT